MSELFVIDARDVGKVYWDGVRKLQVLKGISLTVKQGESVAVLGPSGSGKTTLLNVLSGLDVPSEGSVLLEGQDWTRMGEDQKSRLRNQRIGFVFQFYHLLPEFTAIENVLLPALMRPQGRTIFRMRERAMGLLDRLGLTQRIAHYPSELSGGEQQRVAIARALMNDPTIVFCDEPTGNLDPRTAQDVAGYLHELTAVEKKTVLTVTHDARVAERAMRVVQLKG